MNLNPIQIILDDNGVMVDEYTILPSINQYATNYELNVAFLNDMTSARVMKAIFTINGVATPAKVLSPTLERIKLSDDKTSYYKHSYQLTQYETQFYQPELRIDIYVYNDTETQIANTSVLLPMVKQSFNKLTPADLDSDSSINSVVKAMYDLEAAVIENVGVNTDSFETKTDAAAKLEEAKAYTDSEINSVKTNITENYATISYVDSQDSTVYNNSKTYTDSAISTSETNTLKSAKSYTENRIYNHNVSDTAHEDIRTSLSNKAEQSYLTSNYYDKTTVDNKISAIDIPSVEGLASESYVNTKIADLVNSAPETLDTLGELATALEENKDLVNTLNSAITNKQDKLESGVNIKTINGTSILGSGDITITGGGSTEGLATEEYVNTQISAVNTSIASKQDKLISGNNIKTINGDSLLGTGDITISVPSIEGLATETYVNNAVSGLASETYVNNQITTVNTSIANKQDTLVSGTNIKTINGNSILGSGDITITSGGSIEGLATEEYVNTKIADLVNSAPETLDTLGELATALQENKDLVNTLNSAITTKQDKLVSGTNIKTINGNSILGEGDLTIEIPSITGLATETYVDNKVSTKQDTLVSGSNIKTINGNSIVGSGNLTLDIPSIEGLATESYVNNKVSGLVSEDTLNTEITGLNSSISAKQDTLVSGSNIKTINGTSILGAGDLTIDIPSIEGLASETYVDNKISAVNTSIASKQDTLESGVNIKTINGTTLLGEGDLTLNIPSIEGLASETYVNTKIANLVNSAPETLDTLGELATALQENKDVVDALNTSIANKQDKLVSGTNIKTINGATLLGTGDLTIDIPSIEGLATETYVNNALTSKQDTLVSGSNIKTVNGNSILGAGDLTIDIPSIEGLATEAYVTSALTSKQDTLVSGTNIKTINGSTILGEGDLSITVSNANAVSFETLEAMVATLNTALQGEYEQYETIYIAEQNVPDFWIYSVENTPVTGTVPTEFTAQFYQFGYYKLALLETTKLVSNSNITYSATAPENPTVGDIWLNPTSAEFYDLPAYSADTSGSVLGVNSSGALEWTKTYGTYGLTKIGTINAELTTSEIEYSFTTSGAVFYIVMYQTGSDNVTNYGYFPLFVPIGLTSGKIGATIGSSNGITVTTTENSIGLGYISSSYKGYIGDVYAFRKIS